MYSEAPTTGPRFVVTETDELADGTAVATTDPSQLLVRLTLEGRRTLQGTAAAERRQRFDVLRKHSGVLTGASGVGCSKDCTRTGLRDRAVTWASSSPTSSPKTRHAGGLRHDR